MQIDLTKPFTTQDVADLIASKDDSQHRQLRVTNDGIAYLSDTVGAVNWQGHAFVFETFQGGNDYVGPAAAADAHFVSRIEKALRKNWPYQGKSTAYIDDF